MIMCYNIFFKLYQNFDDVYSLINIIAIEPLSEEEFLADVKLIEKEGFLYIPTDLKTFMRYKTYAEVNKLNDFIDSEKDNIMC